MVARLSPIVVLIGTSISMDIMEENHASQTKLLNGYPISRFHDVLSYLNSVGIDC